MILFSACRPVKVNPRFAAGLTADAPTEGFADELVRAIGRPVPVKWATPEEYEAHRLNVTLSAEEYAALKAEARIATLDRYYRASDNEAAEMGISDAAMEEMAREAAELDRVCGFSFA